MKTLLTGDAFDALFRRFERTAQRLETRDSYAVSREVDAVAAFNCGQWDEAAFRAERQTFLASVRDATAAGRRRQRVRVVPDPLTDYLRFELRISRDNVWAGEDIRYLNRQEADHIGLPDHDFWLFDGERLALMYFTADDHLLGAQVVTDPSVVAQHAQWLALAAQHATPYVDYLAADPTREYPATR